MRRLEADSDALLHDLLSIAERPPDEAFVVRVQKLAVAEQTLRAARRAALLHFAVEAAGLIAITVSFLLIRSTARVGSDGLIFSGSAAAGLMLLLVWLCVDDGNSLALWSGPPGKRSA